MIPFPLPLLSMLPIRTTDLFDPPSSPASSIARTSSSPPSSPVIEPLSLESENEDDRIPPVTRVTDPYAASYGLRSVNRGKRSAAVLTPNPSPSKKPRRRNPYPPVLDDSDNEGPSTTHWSPIQSPTDTDAQLWDRAIEEAFSYGKRTIELTGANLSRIPPRIISDLDKLIVLPTMRQTLDDARGFFIAPRPTPEGKHRAFSRVQTAPVTTGIEWGSSAARQKSASSSSVLSNPSPDVELFLGNNSISSLPTELWKLKNLTILSLRGNKITYLPPEVAKLESLLELNVSHNHLTFLPSEISTMKSLRNLVATSNPYIPKPQGIGAASRVSKTCLVGLVVPSLSELALRALLRPVTNALEWRPDAGPRTVLEESYVLPLPLGPPFRPISEPMRRILAACVPGSVPINDKSYAFSAIPDHATMPPNSPLSYPTTGIGRCPNQAHGKTQSIFVQHVEERFTWVDSVAGVPLGGTVPLRWRGCERGCLSFLDPPEELEAVNESSEAAVETEGDEDVVIQTVDFQAAELDFDDE